MRLFLALRTSKTRAARRPAQRHGEPVVVSYNYVAVSGAASYGRVVSHDDSPVGLVEESVQLGNLWAHAANTFDDWEPLEPHDPVTALGLAGT